MIHPQDYFDLSDEIAYSLFTDSKYVWDALSKIDYHIERLAGKEKTILGELMPGVFLGKGPLYIADGARIEPGAFVDGPAFIGPGAIVRHGAYIRGKVILLSGSVLGHASEAKNCILLPNARAPHFAYVGDSILGHRVNLGAGTKLSNVAIVSMKDLVSGQRTTIKVRIDGSEYDTGLEKLGAILGDDVQTGCNAVLNPACFVGPRTLIYPNLSLRKGFYPADSIIKLNQEVSVVNRV